MHSLLHSSVLAAAIILSLTLNGIRADGAPIINWELCTESSVRLNKFAQELAKEVLGGSLPMEYNISDKILKVEASDMCDPAGLKTDATPCLQKITAALRNYSRIFQKRELFSGSEWEMAREVARSVSRLLGQLTSERPLVSVTEEPSHSKDWMQEDLLRYSVERLLSFSIIVARVFAAGNPANHGNAPPALCHQN